MKPPTLSQVAQYFRQLLATPDLAKAFFDRYQANGWTVTRINAQTHWRPERKPMKQWKSAARRFVEQSRVTTKNKTYRRAR